MLNASKARKQIISAFLLACCIGMVSGCSLLHGRDTSTDNIVIPHTDAKTDTKHESCIRACSHEHELCNDGPASRNETFDAPQQFVGAAAGCDQSLRECLKTCK